MPLNLTKTFSTSAKRCVVLSIIAILLTGALVQIVTRTKTQGNAAAGAGAGSAKSVGTNAAASASGGGSGNVAKGTVYASGYGSGYGDSFSAKGFAEIKGNGGGGSSIKKTS